MSYNPGGYPPYGGPPPQHQEGYGQPPQGQHPSQGQYGPPPQQGQYGYGPNNQGPYPPQNQYGAPPPGQYGQQQQQPPPPQGYYGQQPPPGQYGHPQPPHGAPPPGQYPPQGQYGAPPPGQHGGPPPGQYGAPPPSQGAYPSHPQGGHPPPGQQSYGAPTAPYGAPPHQYGGPPVQPTPPTPGYIPNQMVQVDLSRTADALRNAMKGFGTNEAALIQHLAHLPALEVPVLKQQFHQRHHRSLEKDVEKEVSGYFEMALLSILRGPLQQDVWCLNKSLKGAGTKEDLLNDVLVGRSNADLHAIKQAYQHTYGRSLDADVQSDLSMKTARLFKMILAGTRMEDASPVIPHQVDADVTELHRATEARTGTEELTVCAILSNRSDGHIRAVAQAYQHKYRIDLDKVLQQEFSGHMEDVLIQMVRKASDRAMRDAVGLEECMKGPGTKDEMLVCRLVAAHWDRSHMHQVRGAYRQRYGKELIGRIKGETSGNYEKVLVAMCE